MISFPERIGSHKPSSQDALVRGLALVLGAVLAAWSASPRPVVAETPPAATDSGAIPAPPAPKGDGPHMVIPLKTKAVENVEGGSVVHYRFDVYNNGNRDLVITDVRPGCGCTVATFDKTIEPGKTGLIEASLQTPALMAGQEVKSLTVLSNDPTTPSETLYLVAGLLPAYTITPDGNLTIQYDDPKPIARTFTVQSQQKQTIKLLDPPAVTGPLTVKVSPDADHAGTYQIAVTMAPPETGGDAFGTVDIPVDKAGLPPVHLQIMALGQKGVAVTPLSATFGIVAAGKDAHCTVGVFSRKSHFQITRIESDDPALTVQYIERPGQTTWYDVRISYNGKWERGAHKGSLSIYTDMDMAPRLAVPYWADVQ